MKFIKVETLNDFKIVKLNRPEVKNAFHPQMISEISDTFHQLSSEKNIKAVVLAGEGNIFSAGADLNWMKEMVKYSFEDNLKDSEKLWNMFEAISYCEKPVIGILQGAVYGGALGFAASCDYVFAEEKTQFCFSEVKIGLVPAVISSFIIRKIPDGFVRPLMLSAEVFDTQKAKSIGLVQAAFSGSSPLENSLKQFSHNGIEAMQETKKLLNRLSSASWNEQKSLTTQVISERRISTEGQSFLQKFIDKK